MNVNMPAEVKLAYPSDQLMELQLTGAWDIYASAPMPATVEQTLAAKKTVTQVRLEISDLKKWDSSLIAYIVELIAICSERKIKFDYQQLPEKIYKLLQLSLKPGKAPEEHENIRKKSIFEQSGEETIETYRHVLSAVSFLGLTTVSFGRMLRGKAKFLWSDFALCFQEAGFRALGIVGLVNFLVGIILAFVGAVQLRQFGAQIYIANLVGIGVVREIAPVMTAIVMAGRTGAAYAAQLGAMQANDEIDALKTGAISPNEFLVLPRVVSLMLMMPLLCFYADVIGILGGFVVGIGMLKISFLSYSIQTFHAVNVTDIYVGIAKALVFGVLVALAGCQKGMHAGRSATAVGEAVTSSVVTSIIYVVAADAIITTFLYFLKV